MMRVRLKADGRIVEILADGSERALSANDAAPDIAPVLARAEAATGYRRSLKLKKRLRKSFQARQASNPQI